MARTVARKERERAKERERNADGNDGRVVCFVWRICSKELHFGGWILFEGDSAVVPTAKGIVNERAVPVAVVECHVAECDV